MRGEKYLLAFGETVTQIQKNVKKVTDDYKVEEHVAITKEDIRQEAESYIKLLNKKEDRVKNLESALNRYHLMFERKQEEIQIENRMKLIMKSKLKKFQSAWVLDGDIITTDNPDAMFKIENMESKILFESRNFENGQNIGPRLEELREEHKLSFERIIDEYDYIADALYMEEFAKESVKEIEAYLYDLHSLAYSTEFYEEEPIADYILTPGRALYSKDRTGYTMDFVSLQKSFIKKAVLENYYVMEYVIYSNPVRREPF